MQDALPRLDDAFDGSERTGLDRRQLLKLGAWAAPVIVLATAAPAAAQSLPSTYNPQPGGTVGWQTATVSANTNVTLEWNLAGQPLVDLYGSVWPEVGYQAPAVSVTSAYLTISLPKAGLTDQQPEISGAGWVFKSASVGSERVEYRFEWSGAISTTGSRQFPLHFRLKGDRTTPKAQLGLPKSITYMIVSPQIKTSIVGASTANV